MNSDPRGAPPSTLVVKLTVGPEDPERCSLALTVAATAVASGVDVSLWLAGEASWLGVPGRAAAIVLPGSVPAAELLEAVLADGSVTVCAQCASRRGIEGTDLLAGVRVAGAASFVAEVMAEGARALVY